jgi:hypothetical protein
LLCDVSLISYILNYRKLINEKIKWKYFVKVLICDYEHKFLSLHAFYLHCISLMNFQHKLNYAPCFFEFFSCHFLNWTIRCIPLIFLPLLFDLGLWVIRILRIIDWLAIKKI